MIYAILLISIAALVLGAISVHLHFRRTPEPPKVVPIKPTRAVRGRSSCKCGREITHYHGEPDHKHCHLCRMRNS